MKSSLLPLACLCLFAPAALAQFAIPSESVAAFAADRPPGLLIAAGEDASMIELGQNRLTASYGASEGPALDVIAQQPLVFAPSLGNSRARGYIARLALDQELSAGSFRPFVGVALGRIYGEPSRESWAAGVGGGARLFLQPDTFVHASLEYGWMFSHARSFNDRLADGQWTWSMGVGFRF